MQELIISEVCESVAAGGCGVSACGGNCGDIG